MAAVSAGMTVKVDYEGRLTDGTVFDSSKSHGTPLSFKVGEQQVIKGFDDAVLGMEVGQSKEVTIPAVHAYGERRDELVGKVDKTSLPKDMEVQKGTQLEVTLEGGQSIPATVVDLDDSSVTIDANHQLAGKDLVFAIELVEIVQ